MVTTNTKIYIITIVTLFVAFGFSVIAQPRFGNIYIENGNVFDSTESNALYVKDVMNALHTITKPYVIQDELLFRKDDELTEQTILETERNLRQTGLFTEVRIELDSTGFDYYDVYVVTKDRWSLTPSLLYGTGGGISEYGGRISEKNLLGTGNKLEFEGLYRNENDIKWQGFAALEMPRVFRSDFSLLASLRANRFRTDQNINFIDPYRNTQDLLSYGMLLQNSFGSDFLYLNNLDTAILLPFQERIGQAYFSRAINKDNRLFFTGLVEYNQTDRGIPQSRRAFDNSGKILIQFSSLSQKFIPVERVNLFRTEDLVVGGYGRVVLGKIFPIESSGDNLLYLGGQGEQSYYDGKNYLFGQLTAGSAFKGAVASYTYQEFLGLGFHRLDENITLAASFRQQTAWRWGALRQLILDNDFGLRGYDANRFAGDNRLLANAEIRYFTGLDLWLFDFEIAGFYDIGTVWDQSIKITESQFYNSVGLGLRFHSRKTSGEHSIFRVDFAYNMFDGKFGGVIFTTNQLFSPIKDHLYKLPQLFGIEFDAQ
jgi:outer membrane protein assembly factor BamA